MAVQIPTVQRMNPMNTPSVGGIDVQVPNAAAAVAPQMDAVGDVLKQQVEYQQKQEKFAADTAAEAAANEYSVGLENLYSGKGGFKYHDISADPTSALDGLNGKQGELKTAILEKYKDHSETVRSAIQRKLFDKDATFESKKLTTYGDLYNKFETKVTNDAVEIEKNGFISNIQITDFKDQNSVAALQTNIDRIVGLRYGEDEKKGVAVRGENGLFQPSRSTELKLREDLSGTVYNALEILTTSGEIEGAKILRERYGQYLTPDKERAVVKLERDAEVKFEAEKHVANVQNLPPDIAAAKLDSIKDPEIKKQAMSDLATIKGQKDRLEELGQKQVYERAAKVVSDRQSGRTKDKNGNLLLPYVDINDMLKDPEIAGQYSRMDAKGRKALEQLVSAPEVSDQRALANAWDLNAAGELTKLSQGDYQKVMVGISAKDRSKFDSFYFSENSQTEGEKKQMRTFMSSTLKEMMQANRLITIDFNRMDNENFEIYNKANIALNKYINDMPPKASVAEQYEYVSQMVTSMVKKEKVFKPTPNILLKPSKQKEPLSKQALTPPPNEKQPGGAENEIKMTEDEMREWKPIFFKMKKRAPTTPQELKEFYMRHKGNLKK